MIKKLVSCVGEYKKASIFTPLFVTMEGVMEVAIPFLMARLIDNGINQGNMSAVYKIGILLIFATLISLLFGALSGHYAAVASAGFAKNLRRRMYYKTQDYSFYNLDRFSTASLVTRLTTDVTNVQQAFQMIIRMAVRSPVLLVFSLIMAFDINPKLSLVFFCVIPFLAFGLFLLISRVHPIFERVFRTYDQLNNVVQENLRGIRVVKSFVREDYEKKKFNQVSQSIFKDFTLAEKLLAFNSPMMQLSMYLCILAISYFGARMIVSDTMTTGQLMSMISYISQILMSLMMLSMVFVMIIISRASAERIVEVFDEQSDLITKENPVTEVKDGSVRFCHVSFSYAKDMAHLCLNDINVEILSGQTIGILGATGSAKTSLVQLIPRLYDVTAGSVLVGGIDVRDYDLEVLRNSVAVVLQKNELFSGTIKENLCWGNEQASDAELIRACRLAKADDFIQTLPDGYQTYLEQGATNLSGGQKQRLCIARALLKQPKILILDDSTSAVDTATDSQIRQSFRMEIPDTTKFIIAQRVASVMDADQIIIMNNGQIDGIGTHQELMANNAIYKEVYQSQNKKEENVYAQ